MFPVRDQSVRSGDQHPAPTTNRDDAVGTNRSANADDEGIAAPIAQISDGDRACEFCSTHHAALTLLERSIDGEFLGAEFGGGGRIHVDRFSCPDDTDVSAL